VTDGDRLQGRVAIVTGAARGQGAAEAELFARHGAHVLVTDVLEEEGRALAESIGKDAIFVKLDVTQPDDWQRVVEAAVERFETVDVLVNNAGISMRGWLEDATLEDHDRCFSVNHAGVFLGMKAVFPLMQAQHRGSIINTTSAVAELGAAGRALYSASKAAALQLTKVAAAEWAPYGIRVNSILPGPIDTPMLRSTPGADALERAASRVPIGRLGTPDEIAQTVLFLASDDSSYVTGAAISVDGGRSAALGRPEGDERVLAH